MYARQKRRLFARLLRYPNLIELMKDCNVIIAGGAINSIFGRRKICDYDLYFRTRSDADKFMCGLHQITYKQTGKPAFVEKFSTDNAVTFKCLYVKAMSIQVICAIEMLSETPEDVFKLFDYTICMGAWDFKTEEFILHEKFLEDIEKKKLRFNPGTLFPICSLYRSLKYQKRGYKLTGVEVIKIALAINALQMQNFKDFRRQMMGIDTLLFEDLTDKMYNAEEWKNKNFDALEAIDLIEKYLTEKLGGDDAENET